MELEKESNKITEPVEHYIKAIKRKMQMETEMQKKLAPIRNKMDPNQFREIFQIE